jgi:hypothetical protein
VADENAVLRDAMAFVTSILKIDSYMKLKRF